MKKTTFQILSLLLLATALTAPARAEDESEPEAAPKPPPDGVKLLADLGKANDDKDVGRIDLLLRSINDLAESSKDQDLLDEIGKELCKSIRLARGNFGTQKSIIDTMGAVRSGKCLSTLKKFGFKRKTRSVEEEALQAQALLAIGKYREPRMIGSIEDQAKSRSLTVAKAAYQAFENYGASPGRVRKQVAEILMKRLEAEYPSTGGQGSGNVSAAAQERWGKLQEIIVKSLQAVCRETTIIDIENWREWWKENKRRRDAWKDDEKKP